MQKKHGWTNLKKKIKKRIAIVSLTVFQSVHDFRYLIKCFGRDICFKRSCDFATYK